MYRLVPFDQNFFFFFFFSLILLLIIIQSHIMSIQYIYYLCHTVKFVDQIVSKNSFNVGLSSLGIFSLLKGMVKMKLVAPSVESNAMSPPCRLMILYAIKRPSPLPSVSVRKTLDALKNLEKTIRFSFSGIPGPLSDTVISANSFFFDKTTLIFPPFGVYLIALSRILVSASDNFSLSAKIGWKLSLISSSRKSIALLSAAES